MIYPLKDYFWPDSCPRCGLKMSVGDKLVRMKNTIANIGGVLGGKEVKAKAGEAGKCTFCAKSGGRT